MVLFRTSFCCCGCSLGFGTMALLILNSIFYFIFFIICLSSEEATGLVKFIAFVFCFIEFMGIFGAVKKMPWLLVPHILTQVIFLIVYVVAVIGLLVTRAWIYEKIEHLSRVIPIGRDPKEIQSIMETLYLVVIFFLIFLFVLQYHFFLVVMSYCFEMREENSPRSVLPIARTNNDDAGDSPY